MPFWSCWLFGGFDLNFLYTRSDIWDNVTLILLTHVFLIWLVIVSYSPYTRLGSYFGSRNCSAAVSLGVVLAYLPIQIWNVSVLARLPYTSDIYYWGFYFALVFCFFICVALYSVGPDHD